MERLDLIAELRQRGYRITQQRKWVLEILQTSSEHLTAEDIHCLALTHDPHLNLATVYRTLELLDELGLVSRVDLGDGQTTYASTAHGAHIHLVCRHCGRVMEASHQLIEELEDQLQQRYHFDADLSHFAIFGLCRRCRDQSEGSSQANGDAQDG